LQVVLWQRVGATNILGKPSKTAGARESDEPGEISSVRKNANLLRIFLWLLPRIHDRLQKS
jgi:hypothetical protein